MGLDLDALLGEAVIAVREAGLLFGNRELAAHIRLSLIHI